MLGKRMKEESDPKNEEIIKPSSKEETKCAQALSENWTPLKRSKNDLA